MESHLFSPLMSVILQYVTEHFALERAEDRAAEHPCHDARHGNVPCS